MTDAEITEKIAGIVGCDYEDGDLLLAYGKWINPLIDTLRANAWCYELMVEFKIDLEFTDDGYTRAWQYHHVCGQDTLNKNTNKAIILAVIEAHKDK
jgi:hypothetical protein